jgi:pyruvate-formate lyase
MKHILYVTVRVEVESFEYDNVETIIDEFKGNTDYSFSSTSCVEVLDTEIVDVTTQQPY